MSKIFITVAATAVISATYFGFSSAYWNTVSQLRFDTRVALYSYTSGEYLKNDMFPCSHGRASFSTVIRLPSSDMEGIREAGDGLLKRCGRNYVREATSLNQALGRNNLLGHVGLSPYSNDSLVEIYRPDLAERARAYEIASKEANESAMPENEHITKFVVHGRSSLVE